jgi:hypothetical protein
MLEGFGCVSDGSDGCSVQREVPITDLLRQKDFVCCGASRLPASVRARVRRPEPLLEPAEWGDRGRCGSY